MTGKGFALLIALGFLSVLATVVAGSLFVAATTSRTSRAQTEEILAEAEMRRLLKERAPRLLSDLVEGLNQGLGQVDPQGNLPADISTRLAAVARASTTAGERCSSF